MDLLDFFVFKKKNNLNFNFFLNIWIFDFFFGFMDSLQID